MKRILAFLLAMLMLSGVCVFSASATDDELSKGFYDYCVEVLPQSLQPDEGDTVQIMYSYSDGDATLFLANCRWIPLADKGVTKRIGEWNVYSGVTFAPYELGAYMSKDGKIYTLEEAYSNGYISDFSQVMYHFGGFLAFYKDYVPDPDNKYEEQVLRAIYKEHVYSHPDFSVKYREGYEYFSPDNQATGEDATPDYVVIYLTKGYMSHIPEADLFGDYILYEMYGEAPFTYGRGIYIPATGEVYDLVDAYKLGIEGIDKVFTEAGVGRLIGDMDRDRKLTVKDATYIQKCLAGIQEFDSNDFIYAFEFEDDAPLLYLSDFNRDRERNIKDATAIQKHIAGLEY